MKLKKAVIIGVGLIGGSIGKALMERKVADEVVGVCRRQSSLDRAVKNRALSSGYVNTYGEAVAGADVVFIATPVHTVKEVLESLADVIEDRKALVTDVGSTKKEIVDYAERFKDRFSFVGGHPLAGSEKAGVEYSAAGLFQDSLCILTRGESTREEDIERMRALWQAMGAAVDVITPAQHDEMLSFTSHLPHVVAYALALAVAREQEYARYVSTGFKDTTRIASSDPVLWGDIFMSNRDNVLKSIGRFKEVFSGLEDDIRKDLGEDLKKKLKTCKKLRDEII
ncbi:MAG: prephenate dehydrogenase/arogenate dehydrogenase family protein [Candidatus Makaraimicrobium thalassicum]|nr:MAG: prephenate dehydrogenase/arogenate dehydrogenase family protein [Candidatus Omnitrophota bacterium]